MISNFEGLTGSAINGKPIMATGHKCIERSGWELLAWAIVEQAVDDLATYCRYENEELRAEVAMLREQRNILPSARHADEFI